MWYQATNWDQILDCSRAFLRREAPRVPWYGCLNAETVNIAEPLLRLHDYGFLSLSSQPRTHEITAKDGLWCERQQRPFLEFFVPSSNQHVSSTTIQAFCTAFENDPAIVFFTTAKDPEAQSEGIAENGDRFVVRHLVSRERRALEKKALMGAVWKSTYWIAWSKEWSNAMRIVDGAWIVDQCEAVRDAVPVSFSVAARNWDDDLDLFERLAKIAEECGMKPVYASA